MNLGRCLSWSLPILLVGVSVAPAAPKNETHEKAVQLVRALGDRSFRVREHAAQELLQMGRDAFDALEAGTRYPDAEVRQRCKRILPAIFAMEMAARVEAFLNDTNAANDHGLPGWHRFRKLVGEDRAMRDLFTRIVRADSALVSAVESDAKTFADERLSARCMQLQQTMGARDPSVRASITLADITQVLFLGTHPDLNLGPMATNMVNQLLYQQIFQQGLRTGDDSAAARKLLLAWLDRNAEDINTGYTITNLLQNMQLKELIEPAFKMANNAKLNSAVRANAVVAIGKSGAGQADAKDLVARFEPLLKDETLVSNFVWNNQRGTTQLRDVALAAMIRLSGQHAKEFGYFALKANPGWQDSYYYLGFQNDTERQAAQKKWQEYWDQAKKDKK